LPLVGLEYFHEYLDRYFAKEQMRRGLPDLLVCMNSVKSVKSELVKDTRDEVIEKTNDLVDPDRASVSQNPERASG
jgi:hypothetical protein